MICDSNRSKDEFGYLTVENCILTGEDVAPYFGYEVPGYKELGLDKDKIYRVYRPKEEIKDCDFSNKPLLSRHADFSAEDFKSALIVGTVGETFMEGTQNKGTVVFWYKRAIDELEKGKKFLSCGYMYDPILEKGFYNNAQYDIKMSNIVANHVAMVDNPRYKPAIVSDSANLVNNNDEEGTSMFGSKKKTLTQDVAKTPAEWGFDEAMKEIKDCYMGKDSEEEKEKKLEAIKEKMKEHAAKDKAAKDKMPKDSKKGAKDKKDESMEELEEGEYGEGKDTTDDEDLMDENQKENQRELMGKGKMTGDSAKVVQKLVSDGIAKEMEKFRKQTLAFDSAIREYERVCGKVNRMAFDSAETVLDTILKNNKRNIDGKSFEQKQAMVEMLPNQATRSTSQTLTIDSSSSSAMKSQIPSNIVDFFKKKVG